MSERTTILDRITIFPIKSLDGMRVNEARILESGALEHDREFGMFDEHGLIINGKRDPRVHMLRAIFDDDVRTVTLQTYGSEQRRTFPLDKNWQELELWLSAYFGFTVKVSQSHLGITDHLATPGPTVTCTASIEKVSNWFEDIGVDEARVRFRANLEIMGALAFWEDGLIGKAGKLVEFQVGKVRIQGVGPCERCVVPSRDSLTGKPYPQFQKQFATQRKETMPRWAELSSFDHFYHFCVLTRIPKSEAGKALRVGDEVRILKDNRAYKS